MGQRANLIIKTKESYELYYNHWCANTITEDLFWGPQHAVNFITMQQKVDKVNGWLDEVWAEGGAVLDIERKVLLIYGGEDLMNDVPLRRMYLNLLSKIWVDWDIRWAYEGIADLADYVGYPREKVLNQDDDDEYIISFNPPEQRDWTEIIGSIEYSNGDILIFPLAGFIEDFLLSGPDLLNKVDNRFAYDELRIPNKSSTFLSGGFHINTMNKTIDFWIARDCPGLLNSLKLKWSDWTLNWHYDNFEMHVKVSNNKIDIQVPTNEALFNRIEVMMMRDIGNPADSIIALANLISLNGENVTINSLALENKRLKINENDKKKILDEAKRQLNI